MNDELEVRNRRTVARLLVAVIAMFGFAFALVPLYDVICDLTGLNGKTASTAAAEGSGVVDEDRTVIVHFVTNTHGGIPWAFRPVTRSVRVHPGEITQVSFFVRNEGEGTIIGQAIPSVVPGQAATHLKKTQCFCFDQQSLAAGAERDMPMIFYLDPALPAQVREITLSYTLYDVTERMQQQNKDVAAVGGDRF